MATLDELANRISVLENRYSTLNSVVNGHTTEIHNLDTRLDTAESKLNNHEERLKTLEVKVEDHERRLQLIENSHIKYTVSRKVNIPRKQTRDSICIFLKILRLIFSWNTITE